MTRLSEALRRAAETAGTPVGHDSSARSDNSAPPPTWQFGGAPDAPRIEERPEFRDQERPAAVPRPQPRHEPHLGDADRDKLVLGEHVDQIGRAHV